MWFQIGVVAITLATIMYLGASFGASIGVLIINAAIIFLIAYRAYFEMLAGRVKAHIIGAVTAFLLLLFLGNFGKPFWLTTTFVIISYIFAVIAQQFIKFIPVKKMRHGRLVRK